jgi:hypothetical protein
VRKTSPPERDYGEELREVAEEIRMAIRQMVRLFLLDPYGQLVN